MTYKFKREPKVYSYTAVEEYITKNDLWDYTTIIEGSLVDNYFIHHDDIVEVFEEKYLNSWASGLIRHIYRKGLPLRLKSMLNQ